MKRLNSSFVSAAASALLVLFFGVALSGSALAQCEIECSGKNLEGTSAVAPDKGDCGGDCSSCTDCSGDCMKDAFCCPFSQCVVSGKKLDGSVKPITVNYEGRQICFADEKCRSAFEANPEPYVKKYDAALIKIQSTFYPLDRCIVSGTPFSKETPPVDYLYNNRLVRFAGPAAIDKFKENPAQYLAVLDQAVVKQQIARYPLDTCVVSGHKLGGMGEPYDYVWANQLVRFCCKDCVPRFKSEPLSYMRTIYASMPHNMDARPDKGAAGDTGTSTVAPAAKAKAGSCDGKSCGEKDSGTSTVAPDAGTKKGCGGSGSCGDGGCGDRDSATSTVAPVQKNSSCGGKL